MTERIYKGQPLADQTPTVKYMIGRTNRGITFYLCCEHCAPCSMIMRHESPCSFVDIEGDRAGHKSCIVGQMPV